MKLLTSLLVVIFLTVTLAIGGTVKGIVKDSDTGDPLIGANVLLKGTGMGASSDLDGFFLLSDVPTGDYQLEVLYVGYEKYSSTINVNDTPVELTIVLKPMVYSGKEITVLADRADRATPVAYSDVGKQDMEARLGSQDIPLVLNTTPSVYATMQGGGAGDARINIRGFNQRNVSVMINGVPVNDMENGWVYWSNWDGLGDASSSIQVQRGLSAVNLATPSIGGTMNIITDPTAQSSGLKYKQEFGNDGFLKSTVSANSGLINDKFALSGTIVRKVGDGVIDKTWTDAWAYYFGGSLILNKNNRLELYALGAPQRHGQNLYKQNIAVYSESFAKDLDDYDPDALTKFNESYATASGAKYWTEPRRYNQNWGPVDPSYKGKQWWNGKEHDRYSSDFINERENYYHKPQVNLNWYSKPTEKLGLFSTVYYSGGKGGGTGTLGHIKWDYSKPSRTPDWNATITQNTASDTAFGILRNSVNQQWTIGAISKANYKVNETIKLTGGIDWRTAEIEHFREVRDLLGGKFYYSTDSDFWTTAERNRKLGDKVAYYFTNTVDWFGTFGQAEFKSGPLAGYGMGGYSMIKYTYTNHFKKAADGSELYAETDWIKGFQAKGGASYQLSDELNAFGNAGYVSKVPIFDNVISDRDGTKAEDPKNEKFLDVEGGLNYRAMGGRLNLKGNFYYTNWKDKSITRFVQRLDGTEGIIFFQGVDLLHAGIEIETSYQPNKLVRINLAGSVGNWKYTDDVTGTYKDYSQPGNEVTEKFYIKDLKSGDAPQTQLSLSGSVFPIRSLMLQVIGRYYANNYANWEAESRTDPDDRAQSWKAPSYGVVDLHAAYTLPFNWRGVSIKVFAHVFNLLDGEYIQDAVDNSKYNAYGDKKHMADDAEVFFGLPRTFNLGFSVAM